MTELRQKSLAVYKKAREYAAERGIIVADTKFEWGRDEDGKIIVDDDAKVDSPFEDERRGAYVQAWVWVDGPAEDDPEDETEEREEDTSA